MLSFIWPGFFNSSYFFISTVGSTFGACVGLFFLAIFYRFALAFIATNTIRNALRDTLAKDPRKKLSGSEGIQYPPFSFKTDVTAGLLELLTSFVGYLLMLAVSCFFFPLRLSQNNCCGWSLVGYASECLVFHCYTFGHWRWRNCIWKV